MMVRTANLNRGRQVESRTTRRSFRGRGSHLVSSQDQSPASQEQPSQNQRVLRSSTIQKPSSDIPAATETSKKRRRRARADPWNRRRRAPKQTTRRPPATHATCRICCEELPLDAFIKRRTYSSAEIPFQCVPHLARWPQKKRDPVCKLCIGRYITARVDTVGAAQAFSGCMEPGCTMEWDHHYLMKYLPLDGLEKYNIGMLRVWKERNPLFTCLNEDCGAIGLIDAISTPGYPEIVCADCNVRFCAPCKTPWHKGVSCADFRLKKALSEREISDPENQTAEMMQKKDARRCPECYVIIEKDGGCSHMWCSACRKSFNWDTAPNAIPGVPAPERSPPGFLPVVVCEMDGLSRTAPGQDAVTS